MSLCLYPESLPITRVSVCTMSQEIYIAEIQQNLQHKLQRIFFTESVEIQVTGIQKFKLKKYVYNNYRNKNDRNTNYRNTHYRHTTILITETQKNKLKKRRNTS